MENDHEIGRVVAVDTAQVTVELNRELKALTHSTYEGTLEIGRINSYIIIPVGTRRIVAMVTRVFLTDENEIKADKTMVALPSSRRLMKATLIGTIDEKKFRQGINIFPVLDTPVLITSKEDLDAIFGKSNNDSKSITDERGYCISIGRSTIFPDYDIKIDPDSFFGKHAAIIGSTGSGKSCTIATILQSILEKQEVKNTRFVILDTNGEYQAAFQKLNDNKTWVDAKEKYKSLYIPTDPNDTKNRLTIPYWFMDSDDFVKLFRAAPNVQRPVLLNALSCSRNASKGHYNWVELREKLIRECNIILSLSCSREWSAPGTISTICCGLISYLTREENADALNKLGKYYKNLDKNLIKTFEKVKEIIGKKNSKDYFENLNIAKEQDIQKQIEPILSILSYPVQSDFEMSVSSADSPKYFSKESFRFNYLETAMSRDEINYSRARENCSTMLMRIYRLLEDSRFEFLFGPITAEWPAVKHSLAAFLRDILGLECIQSNHLSDDKNLEQGQLPFYDRQRSGAGKSNLVIIDLSLLASEILENVTALIGRLIHEFLQRLSDPVSGIERGEFPVVLILEEAQNYIRDSKKNDEESISKLVFERIAREGRKFGLGLVIASQRPSELSKTVLSQCNSFIVHRLQNQEDLRYFREIVPGIYEQLLDQLPALAPRSALVIGECVQAPVLVEIREANPTPKSKNPEFLKSWTEDEKMPKIEEICAKWEGKNIV